MLRKIRIQNFKSVLDDSLELGRINVFIGENGCGKTNILEAMAMAAAALNKDLDAEGLFSRGIRLARPSLTTSAFTGQTHSENAIVLTLSDHQEPLKIIHNDELGSGSSSWRVDSIVVALESLQRRLVTHGLGEIEPLLKESVLAQIKDTIAQVESLVTRANRLGLMQEWENARSLLNAFVIFSPNTLALRGLQSSSRKEPLGLYGEGLDAAIAALSDAERQDLTERASCISWMDNILVDEGDRLKLQGFKPGRSTSTLYFMDRFMAADNNVFSAENANEGILHVLFYLALFMSRGTPPVFGIDNIETALNPQLCRDLMKQLVELATKHDKQALITTHNPAVLDGLNLHDDEQRLFVVERDDEGHTKTRRVKLKPDAGDGKQYKLSELWMRGHLGGLPRGF